MQARQKTALARRLRKQDTWAEKLVWSWLRGRRFASYKFRRQYPLGDHILDFFCLEARLDIELDGFQHGIPVLRNHDAVRDTWLEARGVKVLRFWNSQLAHNKQAVRDAIWRALQERAPHSLPDYCRPGLCKSNRLSTGTSRCMRSLDLKYQFPSPQPSPGGRGRSYRRNWPPRCPELLKMLGRFFPLPPGEGRGEGNSISCLSRLPCRQSPRVYPFN